MINAFRANGMKVMWTFVSLMPLISDMNAYLRGTLVSGALMNTIFVQCPLLSFVVSETLHRVSYRPLIEFHLLSLIGNLFSSNVRV